MKNIAPDVKLDYAVRVDGDKIIYEVGIPQFDNYGGISGGQTVPTDLKVGHVVAFDVIADTRHSAGFGMLSENLMIEKFKNADSFAQQVLTLTNVERANNGLAALTWNNTLAQVAGNHACDH